MDSLRFPRGSVLCGVLLTGQEARHADFIRYPFMPLRKPPHCIRGEGRRKCHAWDQYKRLSAWHGRRFRAECIIPRFSSVPLFILSPRRRVQNKGQFSFVQDVLKGYSLKSVIKVRYFLFYKRNLRLWGVFCFNYTRWIFIWILKWSILKKL